MRQVAKTLHKSNWLTPPRKNRQLATNHPQFSHAARAITPELNNAFTGYSWLGARVQVLGEGICKTGHRVMSIWALFINSVVAVREFLAPSYKPERHYMRGPGPACARVRTVNYR